MGETQEPLNETTVFDAEPLAATVRSAELAASSLSNSTNLVGLAFGTSGEIRLAGQAIGQEMAAISSLQSSLSALSDELKKVATEFGGAQSQTGTKDTFQGIRLYDGKHFAYLRLHPGKVVLLVDEPLDYEVDTTVSHSYRIVAKDTDIRLYVDGILAIDGAGKFTQKTSAKSVEFGDIAGSRQGYGSAWKTFRYNIEGAFAPGENETGNFKEVLHLPDGSFGTLKEYAGSLYASYDPDGSGSSEIYRIDEAKAPVPCTTVAVTRSNISAVVVDPTRSPNVFGSTGKIVATDRGVQYVLGEKMPVSDLQASMAEFPDEEGWSVLADCSGTCRNLAGGILTIDTRDEAAGSYFDYADDIGSQWEKADNASGWTVEAVARVVDDGTSGETSAQDAPKDVVIALEDSDLLSDSDRQVAVSVARHVLRSLNPWDRFNVVIYGHFDRRYPVDAPVLTNNSRLFADTMQSASRQNIELAEAFAATQEGSPMYPDIWAGVSSALQQDFQSANRYVVLVGTGYSHYGSYGDALPGVDYGTPLFDETAISYSVSPPDIGYSILKSIRETNAAGPAATILPVAIGPLLDAVELVVPDSVNANSTAEYSETWRKIAAESGGTTFSAQASDDYDSVSKNVALAINPLLASADSAPANAASFYSAAEGRSLVSGLPPEDPIDAPGVVINDGTYQEVVQFLQNGIRLKYAGVFAPLSLSSGFYRIRIVGKDTSLAVFAKPESGGEWKTLIMLPSGLAVKASYSGEKQAPGLLIDLNGGRHVFWSEVESSGTSIQYSKTVPETIVSSGMAATGAVGDDFIANRIAFGLPADDLVVSDDVMIAPSSDFVRDKVRVGDKVVVFGFMDSEGRELDIKARYLTVSEVLGQVALRLSSEDSNIPVGMLNSPWQTAEFTIFRGDQKRGRKTRLSPTSISAYDPSAIMHSSGEIWMAYAVKDNDGSGIVLRRGSMTAKTTKWGEPIRMPRSSGDARMPTVVEMKDGLAFVAWEQKKGNAGTSSIVYATYDPVSKTVSDLRDLDSGAEDSRSPKAFRVLSKSGIGVVYEDGTWSTSGRSLYFKAFDINTADVIFPRLRLTEGYDDSEATVTVDATYIYIAWKRMVDGQGRIWAMRIGNDMAIVDQAAISPAWSNAATPAMTRDDDGNVVVFYSDDRERPGRRDIYVSGYDFSSSHWASAGSRGTDARLVLRGQYDSCENPVALLDSSYRVGLSTEENKPFFVAFRGVRQSGGAQIIGASIPVKLSDRAALSVSTFDENSIRTSAVYDKSVVFGESRHDGKLFALLSSPTVEDQIANAYPDHNNETVTAGGQTASEAPTAWVHGEDDSHGFSLIPDSVKSYFSLDEHFIRFETSPMPSSGSIDMWVKPGFGSSEAGIHLFCGSDICSNVFSGATPNSFALAYDGTYWKFAIVDGNWRVHSTSVEKSNVNWGVDQAMRISARWSSEAVGLSRVNALAFSDANNGFACGPEGLLFATTDGGINWDKVVLPEVVTYELYALEASDDGTVLVAGEFGTLFVSEDSGASWSIIDLDTTEDIVSVAYNKDSGKAWALSAEGSVWKTTDLQSWAFAGGVGTEVNAITVVDTSSAVALLACGAQGRIYRSTDEGATFSIISLSDSDGETLYSLSRPVLGYVVYAVGAKGSIFVSSDSGGTWSRIRVEWPDFIPHLYSVSQDLSGGWQAVGSNGTLASGGTTWGIPFKTGMVNGVWRSVECRHGKVVAGGSGTSILISNDGGTTQQYVSVSSDNISLLFDGVSPPQDKTLDEPFSWTPSERPFYIGGAPLQDFANAKFYQVIVSEGTPSVTDLQNRDHYVIDFAASSDEDTETFGPLATEGKRIEWGSLVSKSRSHWKSVAVSSCTCSTPIRVYAWNAQLGVVGDIVNDLSVDPSGGIWLATSAGISRIDGRQVSEDIAKWESGRDLPANAEERIVNYSNLAAGLPRDKVNCIAAQDSNTIWFGTDYGLGLADATGRVSTFTVHDGLPSNKINCVRSAGGLVFVGTDKGLSVLQWAKEGLVGTNLFRSDGLPSSAVTVVFCDATQKLAYIGTDRGLVALSYKDNYTLSEKMTSAHVLAGAVWNDFLLVSTTTGMIKIGRGSETEYLASDLVGHGIVADANVDEFGRAWLATPGGLVCLEQACGQTVSSKITFKDGIVGNDGVDNYKAFRIVHDPLPCVTYGDPLVQVSVNGRARNTGFKLVPHVPMLVFDKPLRPTDVVSALVYEGVRKVRSLDDEALYPVAYVETTGSRLSLYRKRVLPGSVVLGANKAPGSRGAPEMFAVFAVPASGSATATSPISSVTGSDYKINANLSSGDCLYEDEGHTLVSLPSILDEAQALALPSEDANARSEQYVTLTIAAECYLYVAYDANAADVPAWLRSYAPVKNTQRITDMETYVNPAGESRLYFGTAGVNGAVYGVLKDSSISDVSTEISLDARGPDGCIKNAQMTGAETLRLNLQAQDSVTGVSSMRVATRSDFKDSDGNEVPWVDFAPVYDVNVPLSQSFDEDAVTLATGTFRLLSNWNGNLVAATQEPGKLYKVIAASGALELLFDTGEERVFCVAPFGDFLLVGTGDSGRIVKWNGTTASAINIPNATKVTAMTVFENRLFVGATTSPSGMPVANVYVMTPEEVALGSIPTVFKQTMETEITGFAIYGGKLFWASANEAIRNSSADLSGTVSLSTTVDEGHQHSFAAVATALILSDCNGTTAEAAGHSHLVSGGVVAEAEGHTHRLNGLFAGKIFKYDPVAENVTIVHADKDLRISSIISSAIAESGAMFAGSYPNGKILRYLDDEDIFIKSFGTLGSDIPAFKKIGTRIYALSDGAIFYFTGQRWEFLGGTAGNALDVGELSGDFFVLYESSIARKAASAGTVENSRQICAYVDFLDGAGNRSQRTGADGVIKDCYYECVDPAMQTDTDESLVQHRITEIDERGRAMRSVAGAETFYSASLVEREVGVYESRIFDGTNSFVQWVSMSWDSTSPVGTSVVMQVRSADTRAGVSNAAWTEELSGSEADIGNQRGRYLQFRATLRAVQKGTQSPSLEAVILKLRTSQSVHYFTTNFSLPDNLTRGILTWNGTYNPPSTDIVFGINTQDSTEFADYYVIEPNRVFELPPEHQGKNLRVGVKLISDEITVPVLDEFALMFSLANDAVFRINRTTQDPVSGNDVSSGMIQTVLTDSAQGHVHSLSFDSYLDQKTQVNGRTSINAGHSHEVVSGVVQPSAGHSHDFEF